MSSKKLATAIVVYRNPVGGINFAKYRNVKFQDDGESFNRWVVRKFPTTEHVNFYDPSTRGLLKQTRLKRD